MDRIPSQIGATRPQELWIDGMHYGSVYVYLKDGVPAQLPGTALANWLGTTTMSSYTTGPNNDATGVPSYVFASQPFGDAQTDIVGSGLNDDIYFTGKERDTESGNDYFGARYYSSSMGRWLSPDPSQLYFADLTNPQSFNFYSYALNNPLRFTDPTGEYCFYGGQGDTPQNDSDPTDYDFTSDGPDECGQTGGQWIDTSTTMTVTANADGSTDEQIFQAGVGYIYDFGTFIGTMTPQNLRLGFYGTQSRNFAACLADNFGPDAGRLPQQTQRNGARIDPTKSAAALGRMVNTPPAQGLNDPNKGPNGTVYIASDYYNTGGVNQVNANYGTYAHELANMLDARLNPNPNSYEMNYGDAANNGGDPDTGSAIERCMFGSLQAPDHH